MSFTSVVTDELLALPIGKTCCRKALICGMLYCSVESEAGYRAVFRSRAVAEEAERLLKSVFSASGTVSEYMAGSHRKYRLDYTSKAMGNILFDLDSDNGEGIEKIIGIRCVSCIQLFLRGVFLSSMSVTEPSNSYHMEISIPRSAEVRAEKLSAMFAEHIAEIGRVTRGKNIGLYYKGNSKISDALCFVGGAKSGFYYANISIENDIRNNENRATNCVARNISRSVDAAMKHIEAIKKLQYDHCFENLSEDLRYTATLRLENPDATLSELALMHETPLSKSGLNKRLRLILEAAGENDK
ncbi:MAG: DNA-binding protein WhiA [Clostridia bacterium]|nr:DNA-binding protein WhiA [Clostridia bacterium]